MAVGCKADRAGFYVAMGCVCIQAQMESFWETFAAVFGEEIGGKKRGRCLCYCFESIKCDNAGDNGTAEAGGVISGKYGLGMTISTCKVQVWAGVVHFRGEK